MFFVFIVLSTIWLIKSRILGVEINTQLAGCQYIKSVHDSEEEKSFLKEWSVNGETIDMVNLKKEK